MPERPESHTWIVSGFVTVIETVPTSVAVACNHPNWLVLPIRVELIRTAAWVPGPLPWRTELDPNSSLFCS
jgi:hypothetical protein